MHPSNKPAFLRFIRGEKPLPSDMYKLSLAELIRRDCVRWELTVTGTRQAEIQLTKENISTPHAYIISALSHSTSGQSAIFQK